MQSWQRRLCYRVLQVRALSFFPARAWPFNSSTAFCASAGCAKHTYASPRCCCEPRCFTTKARLTGPTSEKRCSRSVSDDVVGTLLTKHVLLLRAAMAELLKEDAGKLEIAAFETSYMLRWWRVRAFRHASVHPSGLGSPRSETATLSPAKLSKTQLNS